MCNVGGEDGNDIKAQAGKAVREALVEGSLHRLKIVVMPN